MSADGIDPDKARDVVRTIAWQLGLASGIMGDITRLDASAVLGMRGSVIGRFDSAVACLEKASRDLARAADDSDRAHGRRPPMMDKKIYGTATGVAGASSAGFSAVSNVDGSFPIRDGIPDSDHVDGPDSEVASGSSSLTFMAAKKTKSAPKVKKAEVNTESGVNASLDREGITYTVTTVTDGKGIKHKMRVVTVDLNKANGSVVTSGPEGEGRTTTQFAKTADCAIAINGDMFGETEQSKKDRKAGKPVGPKPGKFAPQGVAIGEGGAPIPNAQNLTRPYVAVHADGSLTVEQPGTPVAADVVGAVSGKKDPLVRGGQPVLNTVSKQLDRAQMTAIGKMPDGTIVIVTVAGREEKKDNSGLNRNELANQLVALGVQDAIELDGGTSTSLVLNGKDKMTGNRPVGNQIGIRLGPPAAAKPAESAKM
jgi:exopolysaccharide biosynthesis protein